MEGTTHMQTEPNERTGADRLRNVAAGSPASRGYYKFQEQVSHHPASALAIGFGVGFGVGILLSMALSEPPRRAAHWYDKDNLTSTAEQVGNTILGAVESVLPAALARRVR